MQPNDQIKILDFGLSCPTGTEDFGNTGTAQYMAPEQIEKPDVVDHRADIYSVGVVFYELLTGELPIGRFAAPSSKTPVKSNEGGLTQAKKK